MKIIIHIDCFSSNFSCEVRRFARNAIRSLLKLLVNAAFLDLGYETDFPKTNFIGLEKSEGKTTIHYEIDNW